MPKLPLDGLRVADFTWWAAGPVATQTLGEFGADVIHVESERGLDGRLNHPFPKLADGFKTNQNASGFFNNFNANKRSLAINLGNERGQEVALRLVAQSDIFVSNYAPQVVERWHLGYDELRQVREDIIAVYQPMQGLEGPHRTFKGTGAELAAVAGFNYLSGESDQPPVGLGPAYPDYTINPGHTVIAILAALRHRRKTGQGQRVELSQLESSASCLGEALLDFTVNSHVRRPTKNHIARACPHNTFRCLDDEDGGERWCVIAVFTDDQWRALVDAIGSPAWALNPQYARLCGRKACEREIEERLSAWTGAHTAVEVMEMLQARAVPAGVVQDARDMLDRDQHMRARGYYRYLEHPEIGRTAHDGPPFVLSKTPGGPTVSSALLGQHTAEICQDLLGYTEEELAELYAVDALT